MHQYCEKIKKHVDEGLTSSFCSGILVSKNLTLWNLDLGIWISLYAWRSKTCPPPPPRKGRKAVALLLASGVIASLLLAVNILNPIQSLAITQPAAINWYNYMSIDQSTGEVTYTPFYIDGNLTANTDVIASNFETIVFDANWGTSIPYAWVDCWINVLCNMRPFVGATSRDSYGEELDFPNNDSDCSYPGTSLHACGDTLSGLNRYVYNINGAAVLVLYRTVQTHDDFIDVYSMQDTWSLNSF